MLLLAVATAPTVYGIETGSAFTVILVSPQMSLQQHLPFTVLKRANFGR